MVEILEITELKCPGTVPVEGLVGFNVIVRIKNNTLIPLSWLLLLIIDQPDNGRLRQSSSGRMAGGDEKVLPFLSGLVKGMSGYYMTRAFLYWAPLGFRSERLMTDYRYCRTPKELEPETDEMGSGLIQAY